MSAPVDEQLRHYFEFVDGGQQPVDVDAIVSTSPLTAADGTTAEPTEEALMLSPNRQRSDRRWLAVAAVLVAILGLGALFLASRPDDGEEPAPADDPSGSVAVDEQSAPTTVDESPTSTAAVETIPPVATPVEISEQLVAALDDRDADGVASLLAPDAQLVVFAAREPADVPALLEWWDASDFRFEMVGCADRSTQSGALCTVRQTNAWSEAVGHEGVEGTFATATDGGAISQVTYSFAVDEWSGPVFEPFVAFVRSQDPDAVDQMWIGNTDTSIGAPRFTPEAIALFEQYTEAYAAAQGGS